MFVFPSTATAADGSVTVTGSTDSNASKSADSPLFKVPEIPPLVRRTSTSTALTPSTSKDVSASHTPVTESIAQHRHDIQMTYEDDLACGYDDNDYDSMQDVDDEDEEVLASEIDNIREDQEQQEEEMAAIVDENIENSNVTWPESFQEMLYLQFIPSDSDPYDTYKYGIDDSCSITSIPPSYIYSLFTLLSHYARKMNLKNDFFDFLDEIDFEDIAIACSEVYEHLDSNNSLSGLTLSGKFDGDKGEKWQTIMEKANNNIQSSEKKRYLYQIIQLSQHAKRLAQKQRNEGGCDFWKCADQEGAIRTFICNCHQEMFPLAGNYEVDNDLRFKTLKELSTPYYTGYEKLRQLLEGEQPCLQLYSKTHLQPFQIRQFTEQLKDHCRNKVDQFEPNDDWRFEKYLFAQKVLTSLRTMNFSDAEETIQDIYEFLRIRNGLIQFDYAKASEEPNNAKYELLPGDLFEREENEFKSVILPAIEKATVQMIKSIQEPRKATSNINEINIRLYLESIARKLILKRKLMEIHCSVYDDSIANFKGHDYLGNVMNEMNTIAEYAVNSYSYYGWEALNVMSDLVFKEVSLWAYFSVNKDGSSDQYLNLSRFLTHTNIQERKIFEHLTKAFLKEYPCGNDEQKSNAATRFKKAIKFIDNLTGSKHFSGTWKNVHQKYKDKLKPSQVIHDDTYDAGLVVFANRIKDLRNCTSTRELMMLEYYKQQLFDIATPKEDSNAPQSLLKSSSNAMAAISSGHDSGPTLPLLPTQGASTGAESSQPTPTMEEMIDLMPTLEHLLSAQPFKRGIFRTPRKDDLETWAKQVDPSMLPKTSTHAVRGANKGDVYIFVHDLPLAESKKGDNFLWLADGAGEKAPSIEYTRVYLRAMDMDGLKTSFSKIAYLFDEMKPKIVIYYYRDGIDKCLPIGTQLNVVAKNRGRKRRHAKESSESDVDSPPPSVNPIGTDAVSDLVPGLATVPDDIFVGGTMRLPATPVYVGVDANKAWQIKDAQYAFAFAGAKKLFQDGTRFAINDPKPKDVYCFNVGDMTSKSWDHDIKLDNYNWSDITKTEEKGPSNKHSLMVQKFVVFTATGPDGAKRKSHNFRKHFYHDTSNGNVMIIYKGTLAGVVRGRHMNSIHNQRPHVTTAKAVGEAIREAAEQDKTAGRTLYELTANVPSGMLADRFLPRNAAQVSYQRGKQKKRRPLTQDHQLYSILAARYVDTFTVVNNAVDLNAYFIGRTEAAGIEFNKALKIYEDRKQPIILGYDTSFECSDTGYVSPVVYAHPALRTHRTYDNGHHPNAMALLQTMVHQTKDKLNHKDNFLQLDHQFGLQSKNIVIVTDKEFKGEELIPNAKTVLCWNHIRKAVERKATQLFKMEEHAKRKLWKSVTYLMEADSVELFNSRLDDLYHGKSESFQDTPQTLARKPPTHKTCIEMWQEPLFQNYFDQYAKNDIISYAGTWYLRTLGIPDPDQGITSNSSECLNHVKNCFQRNLGFSSTVKPTFAEAIIMSKVFADSMDKDIAIGYYNKFKYDVCDSLPQLRRDPARMPALIVRSFKEHMNVVHDLVKEGKKMPDSDDDIDEAEEEEEEEEETPRHPIEIVAQNIMNCPGGGIMSSYDGSCWLVQKWPVEHVPSYHSVTVETGEEYCDCLDKYAKTNNICAHYLVAAAHCKLRPEPRLTEKELESLKRPPKPASAVVRAFYGKKTNTTLNKQNPNRKAPTRARMFVDQPRSRAPPSPRTPRALRTPGTPGTPGTPPRTPTRTTRTPTRTTRALTLTAATATPHTSAPSYSTYPVYTGTGVARLKHVTTYRAIKFVMQGNELHFKKLN